MHDTGSKFSFMLMLFKNWTTFSTLNVPQVHHHHCMATIFFVVNPTQESTQNFTAPHTQTKIRSKSTRLIFYTISVLAHATSYKHPPYSTQRTKMYFVCLWARNKAHTSQSSPGLRGCGQENMRLWAEMLGPTPQRARHRALTAPKPCLKDWFGRRYSAASRTRPYTKYC